jgi:two-component system, cell cycle sensor histidine kinase and response regulator CckA
MASNITGRKRAELALRESEARFQMLIEKAPIAIGVGRDGVSIYANKKYAEMFGFETVEELRGQRIVDHWAPQCRAEIAEYARRRTLGLPAPNDYEAIGQRQDGSQFPVQLAVTTVQLADGPATIAFLWDLTERKKAEESLRESEERFRKVFEVGPLAMVISGLDNRFMDANQAFCTMLGYTKEELAKLTFHQITHPEDEERDMSLAKEVLEGRLPNFRIEKRYIRKDGKVVWADLAATVVRDREGKVLYGLAMVEDITERKRAEVALAESQAQIFALLESTNDLIWSVDSKHFGFLTFNSALRNYFFQNFGTELRNGMTPEELLPPQGAQRWREFYFRALREGHYTAEYVSTSGTRTLLLSFNLLKRGEDVFGISVFGRDITERKRAEEAVRDSEERYRTLFERNFAGVIRTTLDGRVLECNQSFARIYGYDSVEEVLPVKVRDFYYEDTGREAFLEKLQREKVVVGYEYRARRKDGTSAWVLISASLVEDEKQGITILSTILDITRWRELGEQLRQAQKMDAVGHLAGGVAHDFNNMLQIISGYSELLLDRLPPQDPSRELAEEIKNSVERSAALTRQLLAFSRQQVLTPEVLDLNRVIVNSHKMLRRLISEEIELIVVQGQGLWRVKADPGGIDQVLLNLAVNARDAMTRGGKLILETANVQVGEDFARAHFPMTAGSYVQLAVTDTGSGMDEETQSRIFEPFFTTKDKGKGTGLGLATVYGIIKQSGGFLWVESQLRKGTTFRIYFPPVDGPAVAEAEKAIAAVKGGSETVLLVEDEEEIRSMVRRTVEAKGYSVLEARNGREALRVAKQHQGPIHLLLTDVVMPGISGRVLADRLAGLLPGVKVLYMSGYTDDVVTRRGRLGPETPILVKPFTPEALARKVREVLG